MRELSHADREPLFRTTRRLWASSRHPYRSNLQDPLMEIKMTSPTRASGVVPLMAEN